MLEVGNGLSDAEGRSHFSLWALMKAPLLIGTDLTRASPATLATLGNAAAIAVNQDRCACARVCTFFRLADVLDVPAPSTTGQAGLSPS